MWHGALSFPASAVDLFKRSGNNFFFRNAIPSNEIVSATGFPPTALLHCFQEVFQSSVLSERLLFEAPKKIHRIWKWTRQAAEEEGQEEEEE